MPQSVGAALIVQPKPDCLAAATSSYISVQNNKIFSAGGHTAEVHAVSESGGFGEKLQELAFLPQSELANADKTRKALVYN